MTRRLHPLFVLLATVLAVAVTTPVASAQTAPVPPPYDGVVSITFPVAGTVAFRDDYHDARGGGSRVHRATDLGGANAYGLPVHASMGGRVSWITGVNGAAPHATAGYAVTVTGDDGRRYSYMHLGRNDGPPTEAYAVGIAGGVRVERGQLLGYLGYSGNASPTWPHLHFEIEDPAVTDPYGSRRMNPYPSLLAAQQRGDLPLDGRRFLDVPPTAAHHDAILWTADARIAFGCTDRRFCPADRVTRGQLSSFLARALRLAPAAGPGPFSDVTATHTHAASIAALHAAGIAHGAADGTFGPDRPVTREQMASLLTAAAGIEPGPTAASTPFPDVPPGSKHAPAILALHARNIVHGDTDGSYRPSEPVSRAQMASFLQRTFS
ncbi:S-layer homology domain-containing protein [Egicoccus halophilus]|uniref:SLH domain-containing protein n=1 Tax=Egicoccus halophilus TaxID=1670830 RepID=A0A8J3EXU7_9ACTN|nr:S-layer homology domain-containing protein [Egicoccus halophilus]GGI06494.1 hypothetical protein GCM10011354_19370 [Egicoccus halophilus]